MTKIASTVKNPQSIFGSSLNSQFTSDAFTSILATRNIRISMDGRGRLMDNVFIERLWKSVKYDIDNLPVQPIDPQKKKARARIALGERMRIEAIVKLYGSSTI